MAEDLVTPKTLVLLLTERAPLREPRLTASRLAQNHVARRASHDRLRVAEHRGAAHGIKSRRHRKTVASLPHGGQGHLREGQQRTC